MFFPGATQSAQSCFEALQNHGAPWAALYDGPASLSPQMRSQDGGLILFGSAAPEAHVRLGSVSKLVFGLIYARLLEAGRLDRADAVARWLPDLRGVDELTLADLDTHRSGLNDALNSFWFRRKINRDVTRPVPLSDVIDASLKQKRSPKRPHYANINAILIAEVCARASGQPVSQRVASLAADEFDLRYSEDAILPQPHMRGVRMGKRPGRIEYGRLLYDATAYNPSWGGPAGAMTCRIADLPAFGRHVLAPLHALIPTGQEGFFALARRQDGWLHHAGDVPGFSAWVGYHAASDRLIAASAGLSWHPEIGNPAEALALSQITNGGPLRWP